MDNHMNIRRRVFLNQHCSICGGKLFRYLLGAVAAQGDTDSDVFQTQIADYCTGNCEQVCCESPIANWPLCDLEHVFDAWTKGDLSREEFDAEVTRQLKRASVYWTLTNTG